MTPARRYIFTDDEGMIPDPNGQWVSYDQFAACQREAIEACAKLCADAADRCKADGDHQAGIACAILADQIRALLPKEE